MLQLPDPSLFFEKHLSCATAPPAFIFDFDGTLTDLQDDPLSVRISHKDVENLKVLHRLCGGRVFVLSGRPLAFLEQIFGHELHLTGEHGAESNFYELREKAWAWCAPQGPAADFLESLTERYTCSSLERKKTSLVWHYRRCTPVLDEARVQQLLTETNRLIADDILRCDHFNRVLELKPRIFSKQNYVERLMERELSRHTLVCFGDDAPEAELFRLIKGRGVAVAVGPRLPEADYGTETPAELRHWVDGLVATYLRQSQNKT